MQKLFTTLVMIGLFFGLTHAQNEKPLVFNPSLSPDGQTIAFSFQGDIWISNLNGSNARRITVHEGYDNKPLWSADGQTLAFQSDRYGNGDIFTIPAQGGLPKRLTYFSGGDAITDFTSNGDVIFSTVRAYRTIERSSEIYKVSTGGETPQRMMDALGTDAVVSPNGKLVAFVRGNCRTAREAYDGPANRDVWVFNTESGAYAQITTSTKNDFSPKWGNDNTLYYQSAQNGRYNIFKANISADGSIQGSAEQITSFSDMGVTSFNVGNGGQTLIAIVGDDLQLINTASKNANSVTITIGSDYRFDPIVRKSFSGNVNEIVPSPNGKLSALVIRGDIFITENDKEKSRTVNVTKSTSRDLEPQWVNDSTLIFLSDRGGNYDIYAAKSGDAKESSLMLTLKHSITQITNTSDNESYIVVSPDRKSIAYSRGMDKLVVSSISSSGSLSNEKVLHNGWNDANGMSWSPDSKWLAYSQEDLDFNEEIFIRKADGSNMPINVSMSPKADYSPSWSPDGSKLVFSSARSNSDQDIWLAWLTKADWEKTADEWKYDDEKSDEPKSKPSSSSKGKKKKGGDDAKKDKGPKPVKIDVENIHERLVQVTSFPGNEVNPIVSKDGETIYYRTSGLGWGKAADIDYDLFKIKWDGKDHKAITSGSSRPGYIQMDSKKEYIYTTMGFGSKPTRFKLSSDKKENLPISAKLVINYPEELNQIFDEAWSVLNDRFYDPNFHGQDYNALKAQYKPLALKASTREDFNTMFNLMLGQINASHMGLYSGDMRKDVNRDRSGLIGVELKPVANGVQITNKLPGMPADREISKLNVGDVITAVNGEPVAGKNYYSLMTATAGERTLLSVNSAGAVREVEIRPTSSSNAARYKAWVETKRKQVEEYSNGQLGYLHIQGMNWSSFERFERELTAAGYGKKGIVIDVRYNGGGWTTDHLMTVLTVKQHAYTIPRGAAASLDEHKKFSNNYPYGERLPLASWTKPSIALCNETSYSNAEIFSHAYKHLGIGTLVGKATFGAVISTGGQGLIDGSFIRLPFRAWFVKATEENMELGPAVPDIAVENGPEEKGNGTDTQLKRAVDELLKQLN